MESLPIQTAKEFLAIDRVLLKAIALWKRVYFIARRGVRSGRIGREEAKAFAKAIEDLRELLGDEAFQQKYPETAEEMRSMIANV